MWERGKEEKGMTMRMGRKILVAVMLALPLSLAACDGGTKSRPEYGEAFVDAMIRELQSKDARSRFGAVHALAEVNSPFAKKALPALQCSLYDEHPRVREEAARAIRKIDPSTGELALAVQKVGDSQ